MNKKIIFGAIILIAVIGLVVGLSGKQSKKDASSEQISIGLILPMSDFLQSYGENARKGAEAAISGNENVKLTIEDDRCVASPAVSAFQKLTDADHVDIVIGPLCGSPQEAVAPIAKTKKIPILLPAAASESLFQTSGETMFNIQYSLENEGKAVAEKMYQDGYKKAVVIGYKNAFSESEVSGFVKGYSGSVVHQITFTDNTSDIKTEIAKLKGMDFDAIFSADIAFYFSQGVSVLDRYGVHKPLYSPYPVEDPSARLLAEGVIYSFPGDIVSEYGATYGLTYDAVKKAINVATLCKADKDCMLKKLKADESFDDQGTSKRTIIFKQIKNRAPFLLP